MIDECVVCIREIAAGYAENIRDDQDWERHGNQRLHNWAFDTIIQMLEYKAEVHEITVTYVDKAELKTSITT